MPSSTRQTTANFCAGAAPNRPCRNRSIRCATREFPRPLHDKMFERFFRYHTGKRAGKAASVLTMHGNAPRQMSASRTLQNPEVARDFALYQFPRGGGGGGGAGGLKGTPATSDNAVSAQVRSSLRDNPSAGQAGFFRWPLKVREIRRDHHKGGHRRCNLFAFAAQQGRH